MKKTLFTLALVALTASSSFAQGIIALGNSALTKISLVDQSGASRFASSTDGLKISVYFGPAGASADALVLAPGTDGFNIGTTAGVLVGTGLSAFSLPGTEGGQTVSLQIRATANGGYVGETKVAQVSLTAAPSSGQVIWQLASQTNPNRFTPLALTVVPEPSTIALGVLGLGSLLLFRRRK